jgi:alpha-amylase
VLDGPLGRESDLKSLVEAAHGRGMKIVVDVVFNQMSNYQQDFDNLTYPFFSKNDFHPKTCIDYGSRWSVVHGWLNCDLPDLATETPYVRQQAKNYLGKLLALGADGFRFDAMKHIEPEFFRDVLPVVPATTFKYGEYIAQSASSYEPHEYTDIGGLSVTDFWLLATMLRAFGPGGDLRELADVNLVGAGKALPGVVAVTFATNHDIEKGQIGYRFGDAQDAVLAQAFVLARQEGFPLVYNSYYFDPTTRAGVAFHERMLHEPQFFRNGGEVAAGADNANLLFVERGSRGVAIIYKGDAFFDVATAALPGLAPGCYRELHYGFSVVVGSDKRVTRWGDPSRGGIQIGPRTALFLVQSPGDCS